MNKKKIKVYIEKFGEAPFHGHITLDVVEGRLERLSDFMCRDSKFLAVEIGKKVRIINKDYIVEVRPELK